MGADKKVQICSPKFEVLLLTKLATEITLNMACIWFDWYICSPSQQRYSCPCAKHRTMKVYQGVEVTLHTFLISALCGCEWTTSSLAAVPHGEKALGIHCIKGSLSHIGGPDVVANRIIPVPVVSQIQAIHPLTSQSLNWVQLKSPPLKCV